MISKLLMYYSLKGNTKGMIDKIFFDDWSIIDLRKNILTHEELNKYKIVFIATSTYGRGAPPPPFFKMKNALLELRNKKIGLFGSGRSEYQYFCGALDVLEEVLKENNEILFKFKFEGYPREQDFIDLKHNIKEWL